MSQVVVGLGRLNELSSWTETHSILSPIRCEFAPGLVNYKKGALDLQPQVIQFTSCLPMIGGSLRVLHDIAEILLKVALKHKKSNQMFAQLRYSLVSYREYLHYKQLQLYRCCSPLILQLCPIQLFRDYKAQQKYSSSSITFTGCK